jgi:FG-GAP-like repeat/ASPIC and UnbV
MTRIYWLLLLLIFAFPFFIDAGLIFQLGPVALENVAQAFGILRITPSFGAAVYDANQDGWPDLLISNHGLVPTIFINQQGRSFRENSSMLKLQGADRHSPALADFDNDGDQDLYFLHGAHDGTGEKENEFFINPGHGRPFVKVFDPALIDFKGRGRTGAWFDFDNDGFLDLLVVNNKRSDAPNRLIKNNGNGTFTDATDTSGLGLSINSEGGSLAADFDNDGEMDVFYVNTDNRPYLMMNQGDGTFRDETAMRGVPLVSNIWSASAADINDDGALDLYLSRGLDGAIAEGAVMAAHRLNFIQVTRPASDRVDMLSFSASPGATIHVRFSVKRLDLERLYIGAAGTNPKSTDFTIGTGFISAEGQPQQWRSDGSARGSFFWHDPVTYLWVLACASGNTGDPLISGALLDSESDFSDLNTTGMELNAPTFPNVLLINTGNGNFQNRTPESGLADPSNSRSGIWTDLDNDGDLDLFEVNAGFNGAGKQPHICFINDGGKFQAYPLEQGPYEQFGRGDSGMPSDFNKDGFQDLFILNGSGLLPANRGPYQLFLNRTHNSNKWVSFRLIGAGRDYTNRDAVGAKVQVRFLDSGKSIWRFINGSSGSYSNPSRVLHFGLGQSSSIEVTVFWPPSKRMPNGHQQTFQLDEGDLNRIQVVKE